MTGADRFRDGYASARLFYETRTARVDAAVTAWQDPTQDRARDVIRLAWPDLFRALQDLEQWEQNGPDA